MDDLLIPTGSRAHVHHWFYGEPSTRFAGWQVVGAGFAGGAYRAAHPISPRQMQQWLLLGCHAGSGWFSDSTGMSDTWSAGQVVLLAPGQRHAYGVTTGVAAATWLEWWLLFDGPSAQAAQAAGDMTADTRPRPGSPAYAAIAPAVVDAADHIALGDPSAGARLVGCLIEALHLHRPHTPVVVDREIEAVRVELLTYPERSWNLRRLAARHHLGYDTMRRRFRNAYGVPPLAFLRRERIHRSCQLLLEGATVTEAGQAVGFTDPYFYSRSFTRLMGLSPRSFAKQSGQS